MRNLFLIFIFSIFILSGCKHIENDSLIEKTRYFYVNFNLGHPSKIIIDTTNVKYSKKIDDSIFILEYLFPRNEDTIEYRLSESTDSQPRFFRNSKEKDSVDFIFVSKKDYIIWGKEFHVYKYALNPSSIDGCMTHFWTPELGVVLVRSATWQNYRRLATTNDSINKYINLLTEMIYQNVSFCKGCSEKLQVIPESVLKELLDLREKHLDRKEN